MDTENKNVKENETMENDVKENAIMRMNRRTFVKVAGATVGALALGKLNLIPNVAAAPKVSFKKFVDPLISAIPVLVPDTTTYLGKDYYEIYMKDGKFPFSSQLPVTALQSTTWGYGSNHNQPGPLPVNDVFLGYLGPTIEATKGKHVVVKFINNLPTTHPLQTAIDPTVPDPAMYPDLVTGPGRATPHLHGGFTDPRFDGHPHSWFTASGVHGTHYNTLVPTLSNEAIYEFSNEQLASGLWYHDHAMGITRLNAYAGLAALYFIRDEYDTGQPIGPSSPPTALNLPAGPYEIPLVIQDKQFNPDGSLFYPTVGISTTHLIWVPEFFGDTAVVNAQAFPFLNVEPRRYRFRMVNGSQARFYNMWLAGPGKSNLPIWVIGMEQSLLSGNAVPLQQLLLAPGERADVIVDFTGMAGKTFVLNNNANVPYPGGGRKGGPNIPDIMQINVVSPLIGTDPTTPPANLILPTVTPLVATALSREIVMKETLDLLGIPIHVRLNEKWFDDGTIDETPVVGSTEIWQFINLTVDAHPMHMHLVKFQVVNRQAFNVLAYDTAYLAWVAAGRNPLTKPVLANYTVGFPILPPAPEESGWKDTVKAYPGQITRVISKFDLPSTVSAPAEYVYHCHILEHEENEMMRPFQVIP